MDGHLVSVKVCVECGTDQRMEPYCLSFDKYGFKSLYPKAVKRRRPVEHYGMILDYALKYGPDFVPASFDKSSCALDVGGKAAFDQLVHDKRLEELKRHLLRQTALVDLQAGSDNDDGASRIVNSFSKQILTETSFFAPEQVCKALEGPVACPKHCLAPAAVVYQSIHRFLEHPLLVAHYDLRGFQLLKLAKAVVSVYDPAVEVIEV